LTDSKQKSKHKGCLPLVRAVFGAVDARVRLPMMQLVAALLALLLLQTCTCVTSPSPVIAKYGIVLPAQHGSPMLGHGIAQREQPAVGLLCRLRGGASDPVSSLPMRQGSSIEKEKPAASEVEAARCVVATQNKNASAKMRVPCI